MIQHQRKVCDSCTKEHKGKTETDLRKEDEASVQESKCSGCNKKPGKSAEECKREQEEMSKDGQSNVIEPDQICGSLDILVVRYWV